MYSGTLKKSDLDGGAGEMPAVRDFRIVSISLTRHEWEVLTKRLREYNAENPGHQIQAGRMFWQVIAAIEGACQVPADVEGSKLKVEGSEAETERCVEGVK